MQISLIGPVEAVGADLKLLVLGPVKQRTVFACLAFEPGRVVSTDRLIEAVWDEDPPRSALATVQGLVYQLRRVLGPDAIESRSPGYRLAAGSVVLDVGVLRSASASGQVDVLGDALDRIRGKALENLHATSVVVAMRAQIDEARLLAVERWCDLALSERRAAEVVQRVETELLEHRWRESLWERLMLALYLGDRQADAVRAFDRVRRTLVEGLGVEPGQSIQLLFRRILDQDALLHAPVTTTPSALSPPRPAPADQSGASQPSATRVRAGSDEHLPRLAGRAGELDHLRTRVVMPMGSVSMVLGEPGIGKSRLVSELADEFATRHGTVLFGRCPDGGWALPYAPIVEAVEQHVAAMAPSESRRLLEPFVEALGRVSPAVRALFPRDVGPDIGDSAERRFEILDAFRRFIESLADAAPVLLVLDDLHWVDEATLTALSFLIPFASTMKLHVLGTYRDSEVDDRHPVSALLTDAQRHVRVERVRLGGLSTTAASGLVEELIGEADATTVDGLVSASGGNPFFLVELARFHRDGHVGEMPDSVSDTIRRRLNRLQPNTGKLLRVGALFDGTFPFGSTRAVADLEEDEALDALDDAMAAHLIEASSDRLDEFRFVHALTRAAVRSTINSSRMPRMCRALAEQLDAERGPASLGDPGRIAALYHASRALPGAERGVDVALEAAGHAETVAAHAQRADLLRMALDLIGADDPRRPRVRADLVVASVRAFRTNEIIDHGLDAAEAIRATEGDGAACQFLTDLAIDVRMSGSYPRKLAFHRWLDRGIELGASNPSPSYRYILTSRHGMRISESSSAEERASLFAAPGFVAAGAAVTSDGFPRIERLAVIAAVANRDEARAAAAKCPVNVFEYTGEFDRAREWALGEIEPRRRLGQSGSLMEALCVAACAEACLGRLSHARRLLAEQAEFERTVPVQSGVLLRMFSADFAVTSLSDGPWDAYIERTRTVRERIVEAQVFEERTLSGLLPWANVASIAAVRARRGRHGGAIELLPELVRYLHIANVGELFGSYPQVGAACAEAVWWANDTTHASTLHDVLTDRWLPCDFRYYLPEVRLSLARLCSVLGRHDDAAAWFAEARVAFAAENATPFLAIIDHDEALAMLRRSPAVNIAAAGELLDRAVDQFVQIGGMDRWVARAEALRTPR